MSGFRSALEEWAAEPLGTVSDDQLCADVAELARVEEQVRAQRLHRLAEVERRGSVEHDGYLSTAAWLRHRARCHATTAGVEVATARALEPPLRVLVGAHHHPEAYRAYQGTLVEAAGTLTVRQLGRVVDYWAQNLDPEAQDSAHQRRRLHVSATYGGQVRVGGAGSRCSSTRQPSSSRVPATMCPRRPERSWPRNREVVARLEGLSPLVMPSGRLHDVV